MSSRKDISGSSAQEKGAKAGRSGGNFEDKLKEERKKGGKRKEGRKKEGRRRRRRAVMGRAIGATDRYTRRLTCRRDLSMSDSPLSGG